MRTRRMIAVLTTLVIGMGVLGACSGSDESGAGTEAIGAPAQRRAEREGYVAEPVPVGAAEMEAGSADSGMSGTGAMDNLGGGEQPPAARCRNSIDIGPSVIKTATIEVEVPKG